MKLRRAIWSICGVAIFAGGAGSSLRAQTPAFEAASLKPANPGVRQRRPGLQGGPGTSDPERIRYSSITLRDLILLAYRVQAYQVVAADAKGLEAGTFNVEARLAAGSTTADLRQMLQGLLKERFRLAAHRESREAAGFALVVAKGGPKLQAAKQEAVGANDGFDPLPPAPPNALEVHEDGYPNVPPREGAWTVVLNSGFARTRQVSASMGDLAQTISKQIAKPVDDATGLAGRYEFTLSWMAAMPVQSAAAGGPEIGPDIFAAVERQLGLKLEPRRVPVEVLVIDSFTKDPVGN